MSVLPQLERDLVRAARRQARRRRARRLRRPSRGLVIAFAALLVAAGGALAASGILFGSGEHERQPAGIEGPPRPGTQHLLAVRTADPAGGPPWGIRAYRTTRGRECLQVGRVLAGRLGVLGIDGAFGDDGRFHPVPVQTSDCFRPGVVRGLGGGFEPRPASGELYGVHGTCEPAVERRARRAELRRLQALQRRGPLSAASRRKLARTRAIDRERRTLCPPGALRTIVADVAGPQARSVTLHALAGPVTRRVDPRDDGAFLFVLRGWPSDVIPELPPYVSVTYRDGVTCPDDGPAHCAGPTQMRRP